MQCRSKPPCQPGTYLKPMPKMNSDNDAVAIATQYHMMLLTSGTTRRRGISGTSVTVDITSEFSSFTFFSLVQALNTIKRPSSRLMYVISLDFCPENIYFWTTF